MELNAKEIRDTKIGIKKSMKKDVKKDLDYAPLYKFILSKVCENFEDVYQEALSKIIDWPSCPCCTHTWNGTPYKNKFNLEKWGLESYKNVVFK